MKPDHNPSIHLEPHLQGHAEVDPKEDVAARNVARAAEKAGLDQHVEHSVWDEPGLSGDLAGKTPKGALNYRNWLEYRVEQMTAAKSWAITVMIALAAGPWSLYGTFYAMLFNGGTGLPQQQSITLITIFGPLVEEVMKVAAILWVVEKRPYYFTSRLQIGFCALFSAWTFATIENLLYLNVYIQDPPEGLIYWRWIVCTALHMTCTFISGIGLMRLWKHTQETKSPPRLRLFAPFIVVAIVMHGIYNAFAIVLSYLEWQF